MMATSLMRAAIVSMFSIILIALGCGEQPRVEQVDDDVAMLAGTEHEALGELQYTVYCASCHGEVGAGDGPVASALKEPPTDLRRLAAENGGVFPTERVISHVDGREEVKSHGTRQMPVWGNVWSEVDGRPVPEEEVERRINELVEYIRSIQVDS